MNEPLIVVFQRRAAREIEAVDEWWRANRTASPDLFVSELDAMIAAIALMPSLGAPAKAERAPGLPACSSAERATTSTTVSATRYSKCSPFGVPRAASVLGCKTARLPSPVSGDGDRSLPHSAGPDDAAKLLTASLSSPLPTTSPSLRSSPRTCRPSPDRGRDVRTSGGGVDLLHRRNRATAEDNSPRRRRLRRPTLSASFSKHCAKRRVVEEEDRKSIVDDAVGVSRRARRERSGRDRESSRAVGDFCLFQTKESDFEHVWLRPCAGASVRARPPRIRRAACAPRPRALSVAKRAAA